MPSMRKRPLLKDKMEDFEEFCADPDNKGMSMKTAAKAFLVENGLFGAPKPRKGLEKPTGGDKTPKSPGMTAEEAANLRKTNFREWQNRLMKGELKIQE